MAVAVCSRMYHQFAFLLTDVVSQQRSKHMPLDTGQPMERPKVKDMVCLLQVALLLGEQAMLLALTEAMEFANHSSNVITSYHKLGWVSWIPPNFCWCFAWELSQHGQQPEILTAGIAQ